MSSNNKEEKKDDKPQQAVIQYVQNQSGNWIQQRFRLTPIIYSADTWTKGMQTTGPASSVLSKKKAE